jgi:N-acetylmuramoyl-L-alanine amidase
MAKKIVLDPGHGGRDPGAVGPGRTKESDIALQIAKRVGDYLSKAATIIYTRTIDKALREDVAGDLKARVLISNGHKPDCFVSIHCNSSANPSAHGYEIWTSKGQTEGDKLAEAIFQKHKETFPLLAGRVDTSDGDSDKEENYYVLKNTDAPAVLIELAFINNSYEEAMLKTAYFQDKAARAIAEGIASYLGIALEPADPLADAVKALQDAGIIGDREYWLKNAKAGETVSGENVAALILKVAAKLKR